MYSKQLVVVMVTTVSDCLLRMDYLCIGSGSNTGLAINREACKLRPDIH